MNEEVDHAALLREFRAAAPDLTPARGGRSAGSGFRVYDLVQIDRLDDLPALARLVDERFGRERGDGQLLQSRPDDCIIRRYVKRDALRRDMIRRMAKNAPGTVSKTCGKKRT